MKSKLLTSAAALVIGLGMSTMAIAQVDNTTTDNGSAATVTQATTDNSNNSTTDASNNSTTDNSNNSDNSNHSDNSNNSDNSNHSDNSNRSDNSNSSTTDNSDHSDNSDNSTTATYTAVSTQTLSGAVTGAPVTNNGGDTATNSITTGNASFDGAAFGGIQTANANSGINSLGQAATSLSANANISFGQ